MLILAAAYLPAHAADTVCTAWGSTATVEVPGDNPEPQASGLARGPEPGTLLTMGDAGTDDTLTVLGLDGAFLGTAVPGGVTNTDWEDLARGPCPATVGAEECLYIADIGDNLETRSTLTAWVVPIDDLEAAAIACVLAYEEGVPRDAESFFVTHDGTLRIVTKEPDAKVYRLPSPRCDGTVETLRREAELNWSDDPTGAAVSPDGSRLVLRSRTTAWLYDACAIEWATPVASIAIRADERKGEAISFTDDGSLVTVSEQPTLTEDEAPAAMQLSTTPCEASEAATECSECGCTGGGAGMSWAGVIAAAGAIGRSRARSSRSRANRR
jgi:hypothetical protein